MDKNIGIAVAVVALVVSGLAFYNPTIINVTTPEAVVQNLRGSAGPEHTERQVFNGSSINGGLVTTLVQTNGETANDQAITATEFCNTALFKFAPQKTAASTTLPTGATMISNCLQTEGQSKTVIIRNTTTTAASTFVLKGNTSSTLRQNQAATSSAPTVAGSQAVSVTATYVDKAAGLVHYHVDWYK